VKRYQYFTISLLLGNPSSPSNCDFLRIFPAPRAKIFLAKSFFSVAASFYRQ
jgi:hypothetical protein